ncbi:MAG: M20 family metallopeptidase [Clostridiales bacterium]|nr:M20 family metallopeptidase [Clostridiales bacterium]
MSNQEAIQLLTDVMAIPSVNGRDDEGKVAEYLCEYLNAAGIPAKPDRIDKYHANVEAVLEADDALGAEAEIWNGHLDTVPYGQREDWETDPAVPVQKDGYLYGRGASDMKSGLCAMVYALCEARKSGKQIPRTIRFLGTCDEEKSGLGADHICKKGTIGGCTRILIGEPTDLKLGVAQKGCIWLELRAHGKTSHGAYPEQGCSAVRHIWRIAEKIEQYVTQFTHTVLGSSTANITKIGGGTAPNMIPETCTVLMDIRITPGLTEEMLMEKVWQFIQEEEELCEGLLSVEAEVKNSRRAIEIGQEASLVRRLKTCMSGEEVPQENIGISFFTDASILVRVMPDAEVLLFGPGDPTMAHKPNERVSLEKYLRAIQILEKMIFLQE